MKPITTEMLQAAADINDLDEALASVMDQVGITDGGVAGVVFSGYEDLWPDMAGSDRMTMLWQWVAAEEAMAPEISTPDLEPHCSYGDLFTADEFEANVKAGGFIPSDGDGYWATADGHDMNSSVWSTPQPDWATHVAWFNK